MPNLFRVTPDGQSFYSPYLREAFKLVPEIITDDDNYQGICRAKRSRKPPRKWRHDTVVTRVMTRVATRVATQ